MTVASISRRELEFLVCSLPGQFDAGMPIAAARAGALGILNLQFCENARQAHAEAGRLMRLGRGRVGLLLDGEPTDSALAALSAVSEIELILLTWAAPTQLAAMVERARGVARRVGLVVTNPTQAEVARSLQFDLIIVKGNEAGGYVSEETTFVLLQRFKAYSLPVYAWGGVGLCSMAACLAGGASGVVLDWQLSLFPEAGLPGGLARRIFAFDGTETALITAPDGGRLRYLVPRAGGPPVELGELAQKLAHEPAMFEGAWNRTLARVVSRRRGEEGLWLLGQDASFARSFAEVAPNLNRALRMLPGRASSSARGAAASLALAPDGPLARSHGTLYPILQGPMTRVSDVASFCHAVARGGALPFLALALMREEAAAALLEQTRRLLGSCPWGVGVLGFAPKERREEQLRVIERFKPPFALIAGGRPDQAAAFEQLGIATYLHVPSPAMLSAFLAEGARRFVFEGRECGGHVGPRSSFVLWDAAVRTVLAANLPEEEWPRLHLIFAGGIHDAQSCAMVAALAQPLVERGAKIGVLMGTAYLFTHELVETGATVPGFQQVMLEATRTRLVETGPGHAIRIAETPFINFFEQRKRELLREGRPGEEVRDALERLNLGRLRIASKGVARQPHQAAGQPRYHSVNESEQRREGMYMAGQVAALRRERISIAQLHEEVSNGGRRWLVERFEGGAAAPRGLPVRVEVHEAVPAPPPLDIAIVGMSCLLPGCTSLQAFWRHILLGSDLISEIPPGRFDASLWFDPDRAARDRIYSRWGGFLEEIPFDPTRYGIPPKTLSSIEPGQLLALVLVEQALDDAGYLAENHFKERTSVLFGASGGVADLAQQMIFRALAPQFLRSVDAELLKQLPEWTEDSFAGLLPNVIPGRVSNRFDFGGMNAAIDAACASSLAAVDLGCRALADGSTDMVIAGGIDLVQGPFAYLCFSKTGALSARGRSRAFDESADGIAISEGLAAVILKRRADAERDGDRIYALIKGVGCGSDGRQRGLTAPSFDGQLRTLARAYAQARVEPESVALIEAHGTGTPVGDAVECHALARLLAGARARSVAIGSAKSQFGHVKSAAGLVGLMKAALALYYRVLPATLHVAKPNPKAGLGEGPLYVNSELRPWIRGAHPRRSGVSAFGFGGTNYHAVLEEYVDHPLPDVTRMARRAWPAELFLLQGSTPDELASQVSGLLKGLERNLEEPQFDLGWLAAEHFRAHPQRQGALRAAVVAGSRDELRAHLTRLLEACQSGDAMREPATAEGLYQAWAPASSAGKIAFLYAGQGAQFPNMFRDLAVDFSEVDEAFVAANAALREWLPGPLSERVFPPPAFTDEERANAVQLLKATDVAQPALGACAVAATRILEALGVRPEMTAGHSYGELPALWAAGVFTEDVLYRLSYRRGAAMLQGLTSDARNLGAMLAISAPRDQIDPHLEGLADVWVANHNSPRQLTVSGAAASIARLGEALARSGIASTPLSVQCAFHSPLVAAAKDRFFAVLRETTMSAPRMPVFGNVTAEEFPAEVDALRDLLGRQIVSQVRFADMLLAMYRRGARLFIELGPSELLSRFVKETLGERPFAVASIQSRKRHGLVQLLHALAAAWLHGVNVDLERIYAGRYAPCTARQPAGATERARAAPRAWHVSGARARPPGQQPGAPAVEPPRAATRGEPEAPSLPLAPRAQPGARATVDLILPDPSESLPPSMTGTTGNDHAPQPAAADNVALYREFQQTMRQFLETQQSVFQMFLSGEACPAAVPRQAPAVPETRLAGPPFEQPDARPAAAAAPASTLQVAASAKVEAALEQPAPEQPSQPDHAPSDAPERNPEEVLVDFVSERTGYPREMITLDARLEADLGIDSIKRVEIVTACRQQLLPELKAAPGWFMEEVTAAATLRGIVACFQRLRSEAPPCAPALPRNPAASSAAAATNGRHDPAPGGAPRFAVEVFELPGAGELGELPEGAWLLTCNEAGAADGLASWLEARGRPALVLSADCVLSRDQLESAVRSARDRFGRIAGFVHLLPSRGVPAAVLEDLAQWQACCEPELLGLLHLLQACAVDLAAAPAAAACVVSIGGGDFGAQDPIAARCPWRGGLAGMLKTARQEFPLAHFRLLDVDRLPEPADLAAGLLAAGPVEIGMRAGRRLAVKAVAARSPASGTPAAVGMGHECVILITGGARGITAQVAHEIAARTRGHLVIVGRTPQRPADDRLAALEGDDGPELRRRLRDLLARDGREVTPALLRRKVEELQRSREVERTLVRLRSTGATIEYHDCDVRDEAAFGTLIRDVLSRTGRIDGLVHGAGVIEDRAIVDKTPESFRRVIETKVLPLLTLQKLCPVSQLKFAIFFASVAGFQGNTGQVDYAAANEILNRLARLWQKQSSGNVVSINWGPWSGNGMVTEGLAAVLESRGMRLIRPAEGCDAAWRELSADHRQDPRVIVGDGPWNPASGPVPAALHASNEQTTERAALESVREPLA